MFLNIFASQLNAYAMQLCVLWDLTVYANVFGCVRVDSVRDGKKYSSTSSSSQSSRTFFSLLVCLKLMLIIFNMPECKISDEVSTEVAIIFVNTVENVRIMLYPKN